MELWVGLWTVLLWASVGAFGLVTLYVLVQAAMRLKR